VPSQLGGQLSRSRLRSFKLPSTNFTSPTFEHVDHVVLLQLRICRLSILHLMKK
jgi:hypothetical protein